MIKGLNWNGHDAGVGVGSFSSEPSSHVYI